MNKTLKTLLVVAGLGALAYWFLNRKGGKASQNTSPLTPRPDSDNSASPVSVGGSGLLQQALWALRGGKPASGSGNVGSGINGQFKADVGPLLNNVFSAVKSGIGWLFNSGRTDQKINPAGFPFPDTTTASYAPPVGLPDYLSPTYTAPVANSFPEFGTIPGVDENTSGATSLGFTPAMLPRDPSERFARRAGKLDTRADKVEARGNEARASRLRAKADTIRKVHGL